MMLTQGEVISTLERAAARFAADNKIPIAFPNITFDHQPAPVWLECNVIPGTGDMLDLAGEVRSDLGIMQISVFVASGTGVSEARRIADLVAAAFPVNLALGEGSDKVWIDEPTVVARGFPDVLGYHIPVTVNYSYIGATAS